MIMNHMPHGGEQGGEAVLEYHTPEFKVIKTGRFVRCAVTNAPIPLDELRYWSVERQEAYASPEAVMQSFKEV
jgi:hypothetical protein